MDEQTGDVIDLGDAFASMKESAEGQWDADADEILLKALMALQAKFSTRFNAVRDEVESLYEDTRSGSIQLQNAINSFVLLAQKQFIQNRVSVDDGPGSEEESAVSEHSDVENMASEVPPEDSEARMTRVCQKAVDLGVHMLEQRTIPLFEDDELDDEVDEAESSSQLSANHYRHRRFMAMIGTERFLSDPRGGCGTTGGASADSASSSCHADSDPGGAAGPFPPAPTSASAPPPPAPPPPPPPPPPPAAPTLARGAAKSTDAAPPKPPKPPAKRTAAAALFDSSDSSDEPVRPDAKRLQFAPAAKKSSVLFAGESSDSSDSSDLPKAPRALPKAPPKAPSKKAIFIPDDSTSDDDSGADVRPPAVAAAKAAPVPKLTRGARRPSISSSSSESARAVRPPAKVMGKTQSPVFSRSDESSVAPQAPNTVARTPLEPQPTPPVADPLPSKRPITPPAPPSPLVKQTVPAAVPVTETEEAESPVAAGQTQAPAAAPGKAFFPLPRRGGKVLSSSSESDGPAAAPTVPAQRIPPPPPKKPAAKVAAVLHSSDSDTAVAVQATRKVLPKVAPPRRQLYSSDSD